MKTININGQDYTVEQLTKILEDAKKVQPFDEVYAFHNTTKEEFDKLYEKIPAHVKAYEKECMLVNFYNKGVPVGFTDGEPKYYPYFYMDNFRLGSVCEYKTISDTPHRLCWHTQEDFFEAFRKYPEVFRESRTL